MAENPLVSIIILTYNQESTIARAIDSVIAQRASFRFEIIIGEDHSSDTTADICRGYASRYPDMIRLFENSANKGLLDNYYDCLLECRGDYIADCAGDDFWIDPTRLQRQVDIMQSDPSVIMVHTAWNLYNEDDGTVSLRRPCHEHITDGKKLILPLLTSVGIQPVHLSTALYRRAEFMEIYRTDTDLFRNKTYRCEDLQLLCTICEKGKVVFLPEPTINYSIGHRSVSSLEDPGRTFDFYYSAMLLNRRLARRASVDPALLRSHYRHMLQYLTMQAFHSADPVRRGMLRGLAKELGISPAPKTLIVFAVMSFRPLWHLARKLRPFRP